MKSAFTMIELIFVIVILGLLSAIAIPKMMATRDDAMIIKEVTNAKQILQNAHAEYISQGSFSSFNNSSCFSFLGNSDGNFTVARINIGTEFCIKLFDSNISKDINNTYQFGGTRIKW